MSVLTKPGWRACGREASVGEAYRVRYTIKEITVETVKKITTKIVKKLLSWLDFLESGDRVVRSSRVNGLTRSRWRSEPAATRLSRLLPIPSGASDHNWVKIKNKN